MKVTNEALLVESSQFDQKNLTLQLLFFFYFYFIYLFIYFFFQFCECVPDFPGSFLLESISLQAV